MTNAGADSPFSVANFAEATISIPPTAFTSQSYSDADANGTVDHVTVAMNGDLPFTACAYDAVDWSYTGGGIGGHISGGSCDPATGIITLTVAGANAGVTGSATAPTIAYANAGTPNSIVAADGVTPLGTVAAATVDDGAAPLGHVALAAPLINLAGTTHLVTVTYSEAMAATAPTIAFDAGTFATAHDGAWGGPGGNTVWTETFNSTALEEAPIVNVSTSGATDVALNPEGVSIAGANDPFALDTAAPAAPVINAPTTPTNDATPTITGTGENGATVALTSDQDGAIAVTDVVAGGVWSISPLVGLSDNIHSLTAIQTDAAGNPSVASGAQTVRVDTVAPQLTTVAVVTGLTVNVTFDSAMNAASTTTAANYTVTGTGIGTLTAHPTTAAAAGGNVYLLTWAAGEMKNLGAITITVANATDLAGNVIDPAHHSASDANGAIGVAPAAPVITAPTSPTNIHSPTIVGTGEAGATVALTSDQDGALTPTAVVAGGGAWTIALTSVLSNNTHSLTAIQTDAAGNPSVAAGAVTLQVYTASSGGGGGGGGGGITYSPSITVQTPGSGGSYNHGTVLGLGWTPANGAFTKYKVYYSTDNGNTWNTIADSATSTSLSWIIPDSSTTLGKIEVEGYNASGALLTSALSAGNFTIVGTAPATNNPPPTTNPPPAADPNVTGAYSSASALASTPDINTDKGLSAPVAGTTVYCTAGTLIKGSLSAVYYCGEDGKRYVFVNERVYFTWYLDFSQVKVISDADLAQIPLGGNITYRPGAKLVKSQTNPKVYAVARGGVLRWLDSEAVAARLYGANWNEMIDYIPDAFFVNYTIGDPITE